MKIFQSKGENIVVGWMAQQFTSLNSFRESLSIDQNGSLPNDKETFLLGYFEPGHSFKGKQLLLTNDDELKNMYLEHRRRKSIYLWIKPSPQNKTNQGKRPRDSTAAEEVVPPMKRSSSRYESQLQKMDEIEEILEKLRSKHEEKYSPEQFHCWANLIRMRRHESFEAPPNKPFFGKHNSSQASGTVSSPGKRIQLRTQCIDQLTKWHRLMEDRVITKDEYEEMHKTIMSDIKKF